MYAPGYLAHAERSNSAALLCTHVATCHQQQLAALATAILYGRIGHTGQQLCPACTIPLLLVFYIEYTQSVKSPCPSNIVAQLKIQHGVAYRMSHVSLRDTNYNGSDDNFVLCVTTDKAIWTTVTNSHGGEANEIAGQKYVATTVLAVQRAPQVTTILRSSRGHRRLHFNQNNNPRG